MPDFIAQDTLETLHSLVSDLNKVALDLEQSLQHLQGSTAEVSPQALVEKILAWDEQISRTRLLLPLCTTGVQVNEDGRILPLSDLIVEIRSEFDSLARAQLEVLIEDASENPSIGF